MILEAKNILYSYKSKRDKIVLKNVSAAFEEATFYAIVGSSGSGKTTFLSLLAGLDHPVSGTILYGGEDIRKKGLNDYRRHHVSLVFQNYNLIDYLTAEENLRVNRVHDRELAEFGERILPGGDMFEAHQAFLRDSAGYDHGAASCSSEQHELWISQLTCPILRLDGGEDLGKNAERIIAAYKNMPQ